MTVETGVECVLTRMTQVLTGFAQEGLCGRCLPCPLGVAQALAILRRLSRGEGVEGDVARLSRIATSLGEAARCRRGKEAARALAGSLRDEAEYLAHLAGRCPNGACRDLRRFRVVAERCTMCGRCQEVCPRGAIVGDPYIPYRGDNRPYLILERKCDGCGHCVAACPVRAIEPR
jgi:ferredoxin